MDNNMLNLQLLNLQKSLSFSNENVSRNDLDKMGNQCGSNCHKKVQMLLHNSLKDKQEIKELELKLAKLEENVSTFADKIRDKDDVIAAQKMSIELCKSNKNNDSSTSINSNNTHLTKLQAQINADAGLLKEKDDLLKEAEAKIECLTNQVKHFETLIQNNEAMLKSNANHLWVEGKLQIEARERHINHLVQELKKKDAQLAHFLTEMKKKDDQIALFELGNNMDSMKIKEKEDLLSEYTAKVEDYAAELKEKNKRVNQLEATIKKHSSTIQMQETKLKETEHLLLLTKNQLKEHDEKKTEKLLKDSKAKLNGYTNTIKQLRQNITDLQTGASGHKSEIANHLATIKELRAQLKENSRKTSTKKPETKDLMEPQIGCGWLLVQERYIQYASKEFMLTLVAHCLGYNEDDKVYWMGLETLNRLTTEKRHELYIHLVDVDDTITYARYDNFVIGNNDEEYELKSLGKYTGNAGDAMRACEKKKFSIKVYRGECHKEYAISSWWNMENELQGCNLNATHFAGFRNYIWWRGNLRKAVKMFIRPIEK